MSSPWNFSGTSVANGLSEGSVTLVEGASFSISSTSGDMAPGSVHGVFFEDTRFVSLFELRLDDELPEPLALVPRHPFSATFVSRGRPRNGQADSTLLVERARYVGNGMREDITITNLGREDAACTITIVVAADFAQLFEVKENRIIARGEKETSAHRSTMSFTYRYRELSRRLDVEFPGQARVEPGIAVLDVVVPVGSQWNGAIELRVTVDDQPIELRYGGEDPATRSVPAERLKAWDQTMPRVHTGSPTHDLTFLRSRQDLGALRIFDPERPESPVVAAGAPWFMTLFGRDSLITSMMTIHADPSLTASTLRTLARLQGVRVDPLTEEQPGKILHEVRRALATAADTRAGSVYYGSIDSTPLFVVALGELHRFGADPDTITELLPHADRALAWVEEYGDSDGDGFVEYRRATARGLTNQGWKDSFDGVNFAAGQIAEPPIALCEVQGYVYAAHRARASIARHLGDGATADKHDRRAAELRRAFNEQFWLDDRDYFALGLDARKRPIDSLTSNIGHLLWSGIVDDDHAMQVVEHLCGPELFTGWGIRTLARSMARYNPVSYHNGSVWPHDTAICAAGLARYGFAEQASRVTAGLFEAASAFGGRLPELFCGFPRERYPQPVPYPASCSPQAWAAASPLWLLRTTLLGLDVSIPDATIACTPTIPAIFETMRVENLYLQGSRLDIVVDNDVATISGLPAGIREV